MVELRSCKHMRCGLRLRLTYPNVVQHPRVSHNGKNQANRNPHAIRTQFPWQTFRTARYTVDLVSKVLRNHRCSPAEFLQPQRETPQQGEKETPTRNEVSSVAPFSHSIPIPFHSHLYPLGEMSGIVRMMDIDGSKTTDFPPPPRQGSKNPSLFPPFPKIL